jgi:carbonic anhydrase
MRAYALFAAFVAIGACAAAQSGADWGYEGHRGPLVWGKLDPAYQTCSKGHEQSPIDIRGARLNKALRPLEYHYISGPVTVENDGRTIVVHVEPGSYMVADGVRYELQQFEFHHPSEEAIHGKLNDLDVELLHKSSDGKMAIVEIRLAMDRGSPNAVLAMLWPHLPQKAGGKAKVTEMVNPAGFVPADPGYWTYTGSLPTPPCTEGVRWFVYENAISLSLDQLRAFTALFRVNSRPLQDAHGRRIEANE